MNVVTKAIARDLAEQKYKYGFVTDIEMQSIPKGLSEETIRLISSIKKEPKFLLDFRLKAFLRWKEMKEPRWAELKLAPIPTGSISPARATSEGSPSRNDRAK